MDISPDQKNLLTLVELTQTGELALPLFQRNFVWPRDQIADLLASILKDYFIGTFLFLRTDPRESPFAYKAIATVGREADDINPEKMILDGQQRLTALHYAFTAPDISLKGTEYPYRFFLDLNKLLAGEIDEAIYSKRSDKCEEELEREWQYENFIVPFTEVYKWNQWMRGFERWYAHNDQDRYLNEFIGGTKDEIENIIDRMTYFSVNILNIDAIDPNDSEQVGEICAIFEKMNSTGVQLSVYDLLNARLYRDDIRLHQLWDEAAETHHRLNLVSGGEPDRYGLYTLRAIALMRGQEMKSKALINLSPERFVEDWRTAVEYMEKALERIQSTNPDGFGAFEERWMPYSTMVPVLAALLRYVETHDVDRARAMKGIKRWYWGSVFIERYAGAVESTGAADYRDLIAWFHDPNHQPEVFQAIQEVILDNPNYGLRSVTTLRSSIYKGVMNLVAMRGAKDFQNDDSIDFYDLDDHHIFPHAYLKKQQDAEGNRQYSATEINTIVNKTLIASGTNKRISKDNPQRYIQRIMPKDSYPSILDSHFITDDALKAMEEDDYDGFLQARERLVVEQIKRVVAGKEASSQRL